MTLLLDRSQATPQLHALVVGVSAYDHLIGGGRDRLDAYPLSQLGSPVPSALAMLDWVKAYTHPSVTVGSVEALLSPSQALNGWGPAPIPVDDARIDALVNAISGWFDRCNQHPDNIALFYFCGHGLMRTGPALLAADFGETPKNPFDQSIDFDNLRLGMGSCKASTQLYFVDACEQSHQVLVTQLALNARVPLPPDVNAPPRSDHLVLHAAAPLEKAYGVANQPSRFTSALLSSLKGLGGEKRNGRWSVPTSKLGDAVVRTVDRLCAIDGAPPQKATPTGSPRGAIICDLGVTPPRVPLAVQVLPDAANHVAELVVAPAGGPPLVVRPPQPGPWRIEIDAGIYSLMARFPPATFQSLSRDDIWVLPPGADEIVDIT